MTKKPEIFYQSEEYEKWKKERSLFRCISNIYVLIYNIECVSTSLALVYYLKEEYQLSQTMSAFCYSVVQMLYAFVQMTGGLFLGKYSDRSRNIRLILLANLAVSTLCNFTYTLPVPLWIILMARAFMGVPESIKSAVLGKEEFFKFYNYARGSIFGKFSGKNKKKE